MFKLPFPPSVNTYWRNFRGRMVLSAKGRQYKIDVVKILSLEPKWLPFAEKEELKVLLDLFPPDKRRRDIDNFSKGLLDALGAASVYGDDSQIKAQLCRFNAPGRPGHCLVSIASANEDFGLRF